MVLYTYNTNIKLTCSVPCPSVNKSKPRIRWDWNKTITGNVINNCIKETINNYTITSGMYTEEIMIDISNQNYT